MLISVVRRTTCLLAATLLMALGPGNAAHADTFPSRPVTIVVTYPTGGGTDTVARLIGKALTTHWKQTVIVENVAGGDGTIGTQKVLRAPPDGYTILIQVNQMLIWKATVPAFKYDVLTDLKFVSMVQRSPLAFVVSVKFPGNTPAEFAAWCKTAAKPCTVGSSTRYGQLIGKHMMAEAGLPNATNVNYKGTAPMMTDLLGGHITMGLPAVASSIAQVESGQLKYLGLGSTERFPALPNVPTLVESGLNVFGESWYGLMVRKDTPPAIVAEIVKALKIVSKDESVLANIKANGAVPVFSDPEQFEADVRREAEYLNKLLVKYPPEQ